MKITAHNVQLHATNASDAPMLTAKVSVCSDKGVRGHIVECPVYGNQVTLFDGFDNLIRADSRHKIIIEKARAAMASRRDLIRPYFLV